MLVSHSPLTTLPYIYVYIYMIYIHMYTYFLNQTLKTIFHCDAKYLALGVGVGQCPRRQNFALEIPTCWYLGANANPFCVLPDAFNPTRNLKFAFYPMRNPNASQWNIGCIGSLALGLCVGHVHFFFLFFFICVG